VVDLNDNSLILGLLDSGDLAHTGFLYDLGANTLALLPPLVVNGSALATSLRGIDNIGRVVVISTFPQGQTLQDIYWLPPGGTSWNNSGIERIANLMPSLSKSGWLLAVVAVGQAGIGCYLDLNNPTAAIPLPPFPLIKYIPPLPAPADPDFQVVIPFDANAQGRVVGQAISSSRPFLYDAPTGDFYQLKLDPGWAGDYANGINAQGQVIGWGAKNLGPAFQMRGWVVEWPLPQVRLPLLTWLILLLGVIQDAGSIGITYGGKPIPIDPLGPLLPPEKRDILTTLALGEFGSLLNDPELRQIVKRSEIELLEKATKIATGKGR
jgi:hypothetical protein